MGVLGDKEGSNGAWWVRSAAVCLLLTGVVLSGAGCASPGPPKPPTLNLPAPVTNLTASRVGDSVTLHLTMPTQTTDKLAIRSSEITGEFCRQLEDQACVAVASSRVAEKVKAANGAGNVVTWTDTLPAALDNGAPRLLGYRVEFFNAAGRTAGWSAEAFTAAGAAPPRVQGLRLQGSRLGAVVSWQPQAAPASQTQQTQQTQPSEVLIERTDLAPKEGSAKAEAPRSGGATSAAKAKKPAAKRSLVAATRKRHTEDAAVVWMGTRQPEGASQPDTALDTTALPDTPYAYSALRRATVMLGGKMIEMRSEPTAPVTFTLPEVYPPRVPTGLTAVGYFENASAKEGVPGKYAVDLVWEPVDESGVMVPLAGYNVYRQRLNAGGEPDGTRERLNTAPVPEPSFHDVNAQPAVSYRYSVTAVDAKGNESAADTVRLKPNP